MHYLRYYAVQDLTVLIILFFPYFIFLFTNNTIFINATYNHDCDYLQYNNKLLTIKHEHYLHRHLYYLYKTTTAYIFFPYNVR